MTATFDERPDEVYEIRETEPSDGLKPAPLPLDGKSIELDVHLYQKFEGKFDFEVGLLMETWAWDERKNNYDRLPSFNDLITGLKKFFDMYIDEQMQGVKFCEELDIYKQ